MSIVRVFLHRGDRRFGLLSLARCNAETFEECRCDTNSNRPDDQQHCEAIALDEGWRQNGGLLNQALALEPDLLVLSLPGCLLLNRRSRLNELHL